MNQGENDAQKYGKNHQNDYVNFAVRPQRIVHFDWRYINRETEFGHK